MNDQPDADLLGATPPHDPHAEQAVLGAVLAGYPIEDIRLDPPDFYEPWHGQVWGLCQQTAAEGHTPEAALIAPKIPDRAIDLITLVENAGIGANIPEYTAIIKGHAERRWILTLIDGARQHIEDWKPDEIADKIRAALDSRDMQQSEATPLAQAIPQLIDRMETGQLAGDPTPWPDLDRWLTFQPGRLYTIACRPGVGKSLFGQAIASHMASPLGKATFVASLEMPADEYVQRFLAAQSGVSLSDMDRGRLNDDQWTRIGAATNSLSDWPIWVNDSTRQTLATIRSDARMVARRHTLGAVVVDYLQLVQPPDRRVNREQQVAALTAGLKALAKDLHAPVVLLAQLNRENQREKRPPKLSDLRESGAIEQDSDVVMLLHEQEADDGQDSNRLRVLIEKNRGGRNHGRVTLIRRGWVARLEQEARTPGTPFDGNQAA